MMQNDNLSGSQQLLRNDDASERIHDPPAGISNDVGIAFLETESACGVFHSLVSSRGHVGMDVLGSGRT